MAQRNSDTWTMQSVIRRTSFHRRLSPRTPSFARTCPTRFTVQEDARGGDPSADAQTRRCADAQMRRRADAGLLASLQRETLPGPQDAEAMMPPTAVY
jgi:hypothetical protein